MNRVRELREERKLTQAELAKLIDTTQPHIAHIEADRADLTADMIVKLSRVFKVRTWELFRKPPQNGATA